MPYSAIYTRYLHLQVVVFVLVIILISLWIVITGDRQVSSLPSPIFHRCTEISIEKCCCSCICCPYYTQPPHSLWRHNQLSLIIIHFSSIVSYSLAFKTIGPILNHRIGSDLTCPDRVAQRTAHPRNCRRVTIVTRFHTTFARTIVAVAVIR